MKQIKLFGVLAIAMTLGLAACNQPADPGKDSKGGDVSSVIDASTKHKHDYGEWTTTKEATCTEDGEQQRTCKGCGDVQTKKIAAGHNWGEWTTTKEATCTEKGSKQRTCSRCNEVDVEEIPLADHNYVADESKENVPASCTTDGINYLKCSVCGDEKQETVTALGHEFDKDDSGADVVNWSKRATCTEPGVGTKECTRCHEVSRVTEAKLGHDIHLREDTAVPEEGKAAVRIYECSRCDVTYFGFKATEVSVASRSHLVFDPAEPTEGQEQGARFWGRPIGNDVALNDQGDADENSHDAVFNDQQPGDFFEYVFDLTEDQVNALGDDVRLIVDAKPAQWMRNNGMDFFACKPGDTDWTRGYYIDDVAETPDVDEKGTPIDDYRYILYVDDVVQKFDDSITNPVTSDNRAEFTVPFKFKLHTGTNKISLRMAGGYRSLFYNFTFRPAEEEIPVHEHAWGDATAVAAKGEGYVGYSKAVSTCDPADNAIQLKIRALDGTFADGSTNKSGTREGYLKLNSNGNSISYKFDYDGPAAIAKIYQFGFMDGWSSNSGRTYTSVQSGQSTGPSGCNFGMKFNGEEVEIDDTLKTTPFSTLLKNATVDAGSSNSKAGPCLIGEILLKKGDNTFEFKRYASYNLAVSDFVIVIG